MICFSSRRRLATGWLTLVLGFALAVAACANLPWLAIPEPERVMRAYLTALTAGDCDAARALSTADHVRVDNIWCDRPQVASVEPFTIEDAAEVGDEMVFALRVVIIGGDVGIPPGDTMFCQVHRQPNGAWLVNGCGTGP